MKILEIIERNHFLRQLYPEGPSNLAVVAFSTDLNNFTLKIRTSEKPAIDIAKWGIWQIDYDAVEIELRNNYIKELCCCDWWNNTKRDCSIEIQDIGEDLRKIKFMGITEKWQLTITVHSLIFQGCRVYMKTQEDYYAL